MKKRLMIGLAAGALVATMLPGVASAASLGGCPRGGEWSLLPVTEALDDLDNGNYADQNGDGLACYMVNKGQSMKNGGGNVFTWKDNTNPLPLFG